MNEEIKRLLVNIEILIAANVLDIEFETFALENPDIESIAELNEIIESEISYWDN